MSGEATVLPAMLRDNFGTSPSRLLRRAGRVPAIIYGANKDPVHISIEEKEITKLYRKPQFISRIIQFEIDKKKYKVLPKDVQLHPITDVVQHVDFVYINDNVQKMMVPIVFKNKDKAFGVKRGGFFNIIKRTLMLNSDVKTLPREIVIDVVDMQIGQSINIKDIILPTGCTLVCKENIAVASIIGSKGAKSETDSEENSEQQEKK